MVAATHARKFGHGHMTGNTIIAIVVSGVMGVGCWISNMFIDDRAYRPCWGRPFGGNDRLRYDSACSSAVRTLTQGLMRHMCFGIIFT